MNSLKKDELVLKIKSVSISNVEKLKVLALLIDEENKIVQNHIQCNM
jgi:hypothetical protein